MFAKTHFHVIHIVFSSILSEVQDLPALHSIHSHTVNKYCLSHPSVLPLRASRKTQKAAAPLRFRQERFLKDLFFRFRYEQTLQQKFMWMQYEQNKNIEKRNFFSQA